MEAEFDKHATSYRDLINQGAWITGEKYEDFIERRLDLLANDRRTLGLGQPSTILDFGCGIGATAEALHRRFPGARIDGVDASPDSIGVAAASAISNAHFQVSEGVALPFPDNTFDLIYSNGTFHHIDHGRHPRILAELTRVLAARGTLFVFENNPYNPLIVREMRKSPLDADAKTLVPRYLHRLERDAGLEAWPPRFYYFFPKALKALRWTEPYLRGFPLGAQYYVMGRK
jgi:ubiquinone/menaquinone biosynthesis C-methylase UbiE